MQAVGLTHLILLLVAVAVIAGTSGFLAAVVMQGKRRRARQYFVVGFVCGVTTAAILRVRRRGLHAWGTVTRRLGGRPRTAAAPADAYRFAARALTLAVSTGPRTWWRFRLDG